MEENCLICGRKTFVPNFCQFWKGIRTGYLGGWVGGNYADQKKLLQCTSDAGSQARALRANPERERARENLSGSQWVSMTLSDSLPGSLSLQLSCHTYTLYWWNSFVEYPHWFLQVEMGRLIGRTYIAIARQDKIYRNISNALGRTKYILQYIGCTKVAQIRTWIF